MPIEKMVEIWDEMKLKGENPSVYKVVSRYSSNYNITRRRFKELMSALGKELAERKREIKASKAEEPKRLTRLSKKVKIDQYQEKLFTNKGERR